MKLRLVGLMLVAAFALTAATTASAIDFHASNLGTAKLTGEGTQTLAVSGTDVECTELSGSVRLASLVLESITLLVTYGNCTVSGIPATVTTGEILFNANGSVRLPSTDKFVITVPLGECSVLVQSENETTSKSLFGTIKYTNNSNGTISAAAKVTGLSAVPFAAAAHSACGTTKLLSAASYTGAAVVSLVGGTISIK